MPVDPSNNISGFVNAFAGGGVRTNLFVVNGVIPGYSDNKAISFLCKSAQIPASSLGTIEIPYRGRRIKLPGDRTFQDWSLTIISDANMSLRSGFENWSSMFNSHVGNVAAPNFMTMMPPWSVTQLLRDGNPLRTYSFAGCFPSEVGAIDLSYENNDSIAEFSVTLNYSWWEAAKGGVALSSGTGSDAVGALLQQLGINIGQGF
jgi:T4-like virus tail tube protein gp19